MNHFLMGIFMSASLCLTLFSAKAAAITGEQKTLVFIVNFQENPNEVPITNEEANELVFGTIDDYYRANSYGQLWLTGDVAGLFTVPLSNQICNDRTVADAVNTLAVEAGVPIGQYDRHIYLTTDTGCNSNGSATVSGLPSRASINGNFVPRVIAHELGHNFGLDHSGALECDGVTLGENCEVINYGDSYDAMGSDDMGYFNAFQKERLGWMNLSSGPNVITADFDGIFTIGPYELTNGLPIAIKIPRGVDPITGNMRWFYIEYRQSLNHDDFLAERSYSFYRGDVTDGVVVRIATEGIESSSRVIHMKPNSHFKEVFGSNDWMDPAMPVGDSFTDPESGVSFALLSANGNSAEISVQFGSSQCQMAKPIITASAVNGKLAQPGAALQYRVKVENRNSSNCSNAEYQVKADLDIGWQANMEVLTLASGETGESIITVYSPIDSEAGSYILPMVATHVTAPSYSASADVEYQIENESTSPLQANDDSVILLSKQDITIAVMANDELADPSTVTISVSKPAKGSAVVLNDGSIRYSPANKFKNNDSFTYTISNGMSQSTATVRIQLESSGNGNGGGKGKPN
ncbi:Ig-like domain-containing protein [Thalassotalea fonticola]|uniref:Ig-like domain-containing protein n=1 Tax=Thalassotalea fonticola TaxID=3065649 RepID=A0ABZ0GTB4_9GAMM|nr:Ig-like domain-containing protein [Colwelliaceae bacterium S1-1]